MDSSRTCRSYLGVLYPDSETYDCEKVLERIKDFFELSCWCLHDKDTDENGELKKPHYHWVGQRSACTLDFVATSLELSPNSIEYCRKFKRSVRYLIHADNLGKFQYSQSDIVSSFDVSRYFQGECEAADMETLVDYLFSAECRNLYDLYRFAQSKGLYSVFRRNFSILSSFLNLKEVPQ